MSLDPARELALAALFLMSCTPTMAGPASLDLGVGTVTAPPGFVATHAVATDTTVGTITGGPLKIAFSIGAMSGTQMHAGRRAECTWFDVQPNTPLSLRTACVLTEGGGKQLVVTIVPVPIPGAFFPADGYPANFSAEVAGEAERDAVLAIASSYAPSEARNNLLLWVPRGIEGRADGTAPGVGGPGLTMTEEDPVAVQPTPGRVLGSHLVWEQRDAAGVWQPVLTTDDCGADFRDARGPAGVKESELRVDVVVFETAAPCGTAWEEFTDPKGLGYRELFRGYVPKEDPKGPAPQDP